MTHLAYYNPTEHQSSLNVLMLAFHCLRFILGSVAILCFQIFHFSLVEPYWFVCFSELKRSSNYIFSDNVSTVEIIYSIQVYLLIE